MDNNNYRHSANVSPGGSAIDWTNDKLGIDQFDAQNFYYDNIANGTTKEVFDRRNVIDRKNLVEVFISKFGIKWVSNSINNATLKQSVQVVDYLRSLAYRLGSQMQQKCSSIVFVRNYITGHVRRMQHMWKRMSFTMYSMSLDILLLQRTSKRRLA